MPRSPRPERPSHLVRLRLRVRPRLRLRVKVRVRARVGAGRRVRVGVRVRVGARVLAVHALCEPDVKLPPLTPRLTPLPGPRNAEPASDALGGHWGMLSKCRRPRSGLVQCELLLLRFEL